MTGREFAATSELPNKAIVLALADAEEAWLPAGGAAQLRQRKSEAFLIRSDGGDRLWIVGNSPRAVGHGVHAYLEMLGVRWYMPTEHWTIVPSRPGVSVQVNEVQEPVFAMRGFFGTGGFGGKLPIDPERQNEARWNRWQQRLRMNGAINTGGHYGEAFNLKYRKQLEANPQMLAELGGKRQPWSQGVKPCYSNPQLVELYIQDRIADYARRQEQLAAGSPAAFAVSVEPADGGGHCACADCLALGTISDRVFTLVNKTARALAQAHPDGWVSLLAYNEHALPPKFELEPNVLVTIAPYAFQRTGMTGDQLVAAWAEKVDRFGIYDYWSITDWARCLPSYTLDERVRRFRYWHDQGADGAKFESSYSGGAIGPLMYIASRLYWNPDADVEAVLDSYCSDAFGKAAPPMRRMIGRWAEGFMLSEHTLGLAYRDMLEAEELCDSEADRQRLDDFKRYLHYIRLFHEHSQARQGTPARHDAADAMIHYMWRIYDSAMVHTYRMAVLTYKRYDRHDEALRAKWDPKTGSVEWSAIEPVDRSELDALMAEGAARYQPAQFDERTYSRELVPLQPASSLSEDLAQTPVFGIPTTFVFQPPTGVSQVRFLMSCGANRNGSPSDSVTVTAPDGSVVFEQLVPTDQNTHELVIDTPEPGNYRMRVIDQKTRFVLRYPVDLPMVAVSGATSTDLSGPMYFYVPRGLERIAMYNFSVTPIELYDGDGNAVAYDRGDLLLVDVPAGQDGKVWMLRNYKSWKPLAFLNLPRAIAFTRRSMMVPAELEREASAGDAR